jgi:hypothetical protein
MYLQSHFDKVLHANALKAAIVSVFSTHFYLLMAVQSTARNFFEDLWQFNFWFAMPYD